MNRQRGYTLIETLITLTLVLILSAGGLYGWQSWQQQQRLWQTASQVRDYLVLLRDDANWHNRNRLVSVGQSGGVWCLSAEDTLAECAAVTPFTLLPRWPEVALSHITPGLGFTGCVTALGPDISGCKARGAGILSYLAGANSPVPQRGERIVPLIPRGFRWPRRLSQWPSARFY